MLREHSAAQQGRRSKREIYYDNPVRITYWAIIASGIAASIAGGWLLTLHRRVKN